LRDGDAVTHAFWVALWSSATEVSAAAADLGLGLREDVSLVSAYASDGYVTI
jgi:hypothetical protein